ncbi:MAG: cysteine--tRNA ligase [Planctomycetota bacterium]|nr:cysteine--tRNA ligase [Planctomycetota bacterium]
MPPSHTNPLSVSASKDTLEVYNTLTRRLERFAPAHPPKVTIYACGPTVYNHVHIGNWFAFIFNDVVVRWMRELGYDVEFVMNVTDVDDKIIRDSQALGEDRAAFTERWAKVFFDGLKALGAAPANHYPRATDHVFGHDGADGMVEMIQALLDRGHAYLAGDGSIYYRVSSFDTYGQLAGLDMEQLQAGASGRVSADEYDKDTVADFALWKSYVPEDGDVAWDATFTIDGEARLVKGRPGWHIECSVMSSALLGQEIDLHMGGEDLIFPHHQNEIAQSEAATGHRPFVRYWMHNRHLLVDGQKMSKSKGNFYTLNDVVEHAGPEGARAFRYLAVQSHYRSQMDFSWRGIDAAKKTLANLDEAYARMQAHAAGAAPSTWTDEATGAFAAAMNADFNTSGALAVVQTVVGDAGSAIAKGTLTPEDAAAGATFLEMVDRALGLHLGQSQQVALTPEQQALLDARDAARAAKDWAESDRLRDALAAEGIAVKDGKDGQTVSYL